MAGCEQKLEPAQLPPHHKPALAIVGTSFTAGVGPGHPSQSWAAILARRLHWDAVIYGDPGAGYVRAGAGRNHLVEADVAERAGDRLAAGQLGDVRRELAELADLGDDPVQHLLALRLGQARILGQQLDVDAQAGQRRTQLVASVADQLAPRAACAAALPHPKRPTAFYLVPDLPRAATGKVARYRLQELAAARPV